MRDRLKILFFYALYWISFMILIRGIFLLYNLENTKGLTLAEIEKVFLYGLRMDLSMSGYFLMFTGLILSITVITLARFLQTILHIVSITFLFLACAVVIVDMELYTHWGFRLNRTPFQYFGREAMGSIQPMVFVKTLSMLLILFTTYYFLYVRLLAPRLKKLRRSNGVGFMVMIIVTGLLFIPVRGSFSTAPMNTGFVYFHTSKSFANHAAINVVWNFLNSVIRGGDMQYKENFFDKKLAATYFRELYPESDSTAHVFNTAKPNILLVILEGFTADVIEPLGGEKNIAPHLNTLCHEGILFDNFYGNGDRTDKGIVSVLSGYPAQPESSIIKYPSKTQSLPFLTKYMNGLGYQSSFTYGGDGNFSNFRSYLTSCSFNHLTFINDFPDSLNTSKWGVHDQYVFDKAFTECDTAQKPFFKVVLTLSSHEPFDVPLDPFIKGNDEESLFLNSCHYTDKCVGEFITKAKQQPWWANTCVIFIADHGNRHPRNKELKVKERFRIPMLWVGGAVAKKDTVIHTYATQTDIANTLLAQLDKAEHAFTFSKNILGNNVRSFANYFFTNGYGFVTPTEYLIYDNTGNQFLKQEGATKKDLDVSKAYQEILFEDYNKR